MKTRSGKVIVLFSFVLIFLLLTTACSFQFQSKNSTSVMSGKTDGKLTDTFKTDYGFEQGQIVTFKFNSNVKAGSLEMKVVDSEGKTVESFETNTDSSKNITFEKTDKYIVTVACKDFKRSYKLSWEKQEVERCIKWATMKYGNRLNSSKSIFQERGLHSRGPCSR